MTRPKSTATLKILEPQSGQQLDKNNVVAGVKTYNIVGNGAGSKITTSVLDRLFHILDDGNGIVVRFQNVTITGGTAVDDGTTGVIAGATNSLGGAILNAGGDVITAINGHSVRSFDDLLIFVSLQGNPGEEVILTVVRGIKTIELKVVLELRPGEVTE